MSHHKHHKEYTLEEVAKHNTNSDCWIVVNGMVLDVTNFMEDHPGGEEIIQDVAGQDASSGFEDVGHSDNAVEQLVDFQIGVLKGYTPKQTTTTVKGVKSPSGGAPPSAGTSSAITFLAVAVIVAALAYKFML
mmetsp:Transcript_47572/g.119775  ORF Transcript_47572/g.119775 Transcript_47572/m.119775 type:complete len:133 (-) Transcript_47572:39-437(-)|eukprot:CAMPEP_0177631944 /NCGR_PEP_ID=MMETSP0447-20121125/2021_1 /TAXON_ID=0 /ORGANISM="Stygamoeba regulata, Strain BSH-02190019" /LENGTH=132 /DNA_ID=CAMNT_0019133465 /DNA_START=89 /DNA_END=487 /DNA_ORIENTATION=-